jgi:predicted nucleic acid-binding protein
LLDRGEQHAILLAESLKADRLIIDDMKGRREATSRSIAVIGTLGVLAEAARRKLLDLPDALAALQATNFHAAPELIRALLAHENKGDGCSATK